MYTYHAHGGANNREPFFAPISNMFQDVTPPPTNILRLVVNLDRSAERLESISKQLSAQGLSFQRIHAIDGEALRGKLF